MKNKLFLKIGGVRVLFFALAGFLLLVGVFGFIVFQKNFGIEMDVSSVSNKSFSTKEVGGGNVSEDIKSNYPWHYDITVTYFWVGEGADEENAFISNLPSAWDEEWVLSYGGVDSPDKRNGSYPQGFVPKENPFYFALPYNDLDDDGEMKKEALEKVYWATGEIVEGESMLKNRWIEVAKGDVVCYAQWEDVGPMIETDVGYVFGDSEPGQKDFNDNAGLDVSPAIRDCLGIEGIDRVDWRFVDFEDVPEGDWREIISVSGVNWK